MYQSDFDPYGKRKKPFRLFPNQKENPIVVGIQLFIIFLVVRVAMIIGGVWITKIPVVDDLLVKAISYIPRGG